MSVTTFTSHYLPLIEERLEALLTFPDPPPSPLFEAARYTTLSKGKRVRPLLVLATVEALGGDPLTALSPACAIELVHAYSLVHDDLPCMDNDDFRRGQYTVHKKYDEATAVLTGDFLLTYAFEVLSACHLPSDEKLQLIATLAKRAGGQGMIEGQMLDIAAENQQITLSQLKYIHRKKTAELLIAALEFGAIIAQAPFALQSLRQLGDDLGLAFQIMDDVIDVTASEEKHGRKTSSDQLLNKTTYVSILGLEDARLAANKLLESSILNLNNLSLKSDILTRMAINFIHREL